MHFYGDACKKCAKPQYEHFGVFLIEIRNIFLTIWNNFFFFFFHEKENNSSYVDGRWA